MKHIAIAGAGPAGTATALLLAQRGFQVSLLEQQRSFERVFRGEGLMPAGLAALYQMGLKDLFAAIPHRQLTAWDFYVGGRRRMRVREPVSQGLATQIINTGALLQGMVTLASKLPNVAFYPGWQVTALERDERGAVQALLARGEGEHRRFAVDLVIACDGRYSRLRKLAGLQRAPIHTPESAPKSAKGEAQFDVLWFKLPAPPRYALDAGDLPTNLETPFAACLQSDRQFAWYPSWDNRLQIGWILEKKLSAGGSTSFQEKAKDRDWIEAFCPALPPELAAHFRACKEQLEGPVYLDVQVGCCPQWHIPGLLLIGDAAHPMAPNRAQGINMALRDAIVVANHLGEQGKVNIQEPVGEEILAAIASERRPEIEQVQKIQLAEWRRLAFLSQPGLPYWGFKTLISALGPWSVTQRLWLHEQKALREGVLPLQLKG